MKWESAKLGDLYEVHNGISKGRKFFGSGYPFLSFSTIFNNYFIPDELTDFIQSTDTERKSYSIKRGDVFVTRTSETSNELGMSCVALKDYPNATYNGFTKRLRPTTDRVLPEFVGYYMRTPHFRGKFLAFSTMTTRASLRNEDLLGLTIPIPPLPTQTRIASILSAYDDLIENNRKQIKLLEEAAQRLYKEWFVDFKFPGHENVKIVDGVPEGWEIISLSNVARINAQNISKEFPYSQIIYIDLGSVHNGSISATTSYELCNAPSRAKRIATKGNIIWGMVRPNLRPFAYIHETIPNAVYSTGFAIIEAVTVPSTFLYCLLSRQDFVDYLTNMTNGAAYPAVRPTHFASAIITRPKDCILKIFDGIASPIMEKIGHLLQSNRKLTEARDRLLPKLMSGEIEV